MDYTGVLSASSLILILIRATLTYSARRYDYMTSLFDDTLAKFKCSILLLLLGRVFTGQMTQPTMSKH